MSDAPHPQRRRRPLRSAAAVPSIALLAAYAASASAAASSAVLREGVDAERVPSPIAAAAASSAGGAPRPPPFFGLVRPPAAAAAAAAFAGFGSKKAAGGKKGKAKAAGKGRRGRRAPGGGGGAAAAAAAAAAAPVRNIDANLLTPRGRIAHIRSRVEAADLSPMAEPTLLAGKDGQLALDVNPNAVCVVDGFLGADLIASMRAEAESLLPTMVPSKSTRWDEETQSAVPYDKVGVLSTQIEGGEAGYAASPRLVEYVATLTECLARRLNAVLPEAHRLSDSEQTNKLAVCLGDGSRYDKHIDNLGGGADADAGGGGGRAGAGGGDRRKLTALLYLQPPGSHPAPPAYPDETEDGDPRGGYLRAYDVPRPGEATSVAPRCDRLLLFWSDALVHDVSPSYAPRGEEDRRWALTVWLLADEGTGIIRETDASVEERHFGAG